jgi:hypothetical protein
MRAEKYLAKNLQFLAEGVSTEALHENCTKNCRMGYNFIVSLQVSLQLFREKLDDIGIPLLNSMDSGNDR